MWLGDVVTLAVGTLIVLVLIHLAVFWVTQKPAPQIVYMQAPPPAFVQQDVQHVNVPAVEPQVQVSLPELPRRHGE
jgi:hypothetical protein